ncbi:MAG: hypothetical protein V1725_07175 [archaeon]
MELLFFINGMLVFVLGLITTWLSYVTFLDKNTERLTRILLVHAATFFLEAVIFISWAFSWLPSSQQDFLIISAAANIILGISTMLFFSRMIGSKSIWWLLLVYVAPLGYAIFLPESFLLFLTGTSYLVMTFVFLYPAVFSYQATRFSSIFGILSGATGVLFMYFVFGNSNPLSMHWYISSLLLFFFYAFIRMDLIVLREQHIPRRRRNWPLFLKYLFVFFCVFVLSYLLSSLVHELGHGISATAVGCVGVKSVLFDAAAHYPYTEVNCTQHFLLIGLSGGLAVLFIALLLYALPFSITKATSYLWAALAIIGSYTDLLMVGISPNIVTLLMAVGLIFLIAACIMLDNYVHLVHTSQDILKREPELSYDSYVKQEHRWKLTLKESAELIHQAITDHMKEPKKELVQERVEKAQFLVHLILMSINLSLPPPDKLSERVHLKKTAQSLVELTEELLENIKTKDENYNSFETKLKTIMSW